MSPETLPAPVIASSHPNIIKRDYRRKDPVYMTGIVMLAVSLVIYHVAGIFPATQYSSAGGLFLLSFLFPFIYFVVLLFSGRLKRGRNGLHPLMLFLIMFLVSAYALNRDVSVFQKNVPWFSVILVAVCINYVAFVFFDTMPEGLRTLLSFMAGIALVVFSYLALYLLPLYAISILGCFVLGITLHTFVPLLFFIYTIVLMNKITTHNNRYWKPFTYGLILPIVFVIGYAVNWKIQQNKINIAYNKSISSTNQPLPSWVAVARDIPNTAITEKILKTKLVYSVPDLDRLNIFWQTPQFNFETIYHDPLIMISTFFGGVVNVPENDRVQILKSIYNARHQAQDRLWSGENLVTEQVNTSVKLWPELRIGYTELEIATGHVAGPDAWSGDEEAIYTFHLPEGGVVTSLSLWIDGREEKGILTTKAKAVEAYQTIVGVESRDPSVVHWQEGNTVSVRVFPVTRGKSRKFKIGVTAPLAYDGRNVRYDNIHFQGPSFENAKQIVSVDMGSNADADIPRHFKRISNTASRTGQFNSDWSVSIRAPELSSAMFAFKNYSYGVAPLPRTSQQILPRNIFLDINASWSIRECNHIYEMVKERAVFVEDDGNLIALTAHNKDYLFDKLIERNFSLFPFYQVKNEEKNLVISKSTGQSPSLDDLKESRFFTQTSDALQGNSAIYVYNIAGQLSPYLKSLREFRAFHYDEGDEEKLELLLRDGRFLRAQESDEAVSIHSAGIQITRKDAAAAQGTAPDHLMRLYAYNHILQRAGVNVLKEKLEDTTLMDEAAEAHVVSPFSSLVVLETQKDYDRFNIEASKNSLENASLKSKGAVPEPHEWALIILVLLVAITLKFRPQLLLVRKG